MPHDAAQSVETLPYYTKDEAEQDRRRSLEDAAYPLPLGWVRNFDPISQHHYYVDMNSIPPRSVWQHPRHDPPPPPPSIRPARKSFLGRLKAKMGDLEAETSQAEAKKKQELLSRYTKRREEVLEELVKNPQPRFGGSEYVGPPTSPFGGKYRGLMPTRVDDNMAGWL